MDPMTDVLKGRGKGTETQGGRPCKDRGKDWSYVAMEPPENGRARKDSPLEPPE